MEKNKYSYEDFLEIIKTLRSENGCPWDREQTHMSLRPCMMEEAAEVMAGIRLYEQTGEYDNLREELGDVLLQVVMHAQIAAEEGRFTIEDVIRGVNDKMIRRHPHVFGDVKVDSLEDQLKLWEEIKAKEKNK
jgi:tetrapyrrole methylase family protein/MazG family protein